MLSLSLIAAALVSLPADNECSAVSNDTYVVVLNSEIFDTRKTAALIGRLQTEQLFFDQSHTMIHVRSHHKCPLGHPDRIHRLEGHTLESCFEACANTEGCNHFSFSANGKYVGVCMGCKEGIWQKHENFDSYDMKLVPSQNFTVIQQLEHTMQGFVAKIGSTAAHELRQIPGVLSVERDRTTKAASRRLRGTIKPSEVSPPSWNIDRVDQAGTSLDQRFITGDLSGDGVHLYMLDTGANPHHDEYHRREGMGTNLLNDRHVDYSTLNSWGWADCHGHGSHAAGVALGSTHGVAKNGILHAVRILNCDGNGWISEAISGLEWTLRHVKEQDNHPAVISLGFTACESHALLHATSNAIYTGLVVVQPAGNDNEDACPRFSEYVPSGLLTVGATDLLNGTDVVADFSNFGDCVDIYAPGKDVASASVRDPNNKKVSLSATATASGTSVAAAHVAGAAVLYMHQLVLDGFPGHRSSWPKEVSRRMRADATQGAIRGMTFDVNNLLLRTPCHGDPCSTNAAPIPTVRIQSQPTGPEPVIQNGILHIPLITHGTYCTKQAFPAPFEKAPRIIVTPTHRRFDEDWTHHSISAWSEHANELEFRVCVSKMDRSQVHGGDESQDAVDNAISIEWFAWTEQHLGTAEATGFVTQSLKSGTQCQTRQFHRKFEQPPLVIGSIDHTNIQKEFGRDMTHHAITSWVEGITATQFVVCTSESSATNVGAHRAITFNYIAFDKGEDTIFSDAHGRHAALAGGETFTGTGCTTISYGKKFEVPPFVIATVNHHDTDTEHDALVTWAEEVGTESFRFCGRENEFDDGKHTQNVYVDWAVISC